MRLLASAWLLNGLAFMTLVGAADAETILPSNVDLRYVGRWDDSAVDAPWAQAQSSTVIARFTGTTVSAAISAAGNEYFRIIVDEDDGASRKIAFPDEGPTLLADGLAPGPHMLEIIKETEIGRATFRGLQLDDGAELLAPPAPPSRRIMFYGDSNLAGYSLDSERNLGGSHLVGSHFGLAGITARIFDAEYQNISRSGATISSLNSSYDRIDWTTPAPLWDFVSYPVDLVVVNIGANDFFWSKSRNKRRYNSLLDDLRGVHPDAHIMLYNAYGWEFSEPANYIHEVIEERGDPDMSWAVFPWVFERYHGCQTDHAGMAGYLADHLASVLGWTPKASDVVSGYGRNGDVANGSFEAAAPFGGWGWRYFDDAGVSRVFDPSGAPDGDHFLRLEDGASSHQTNPANDGDVLDLSMWMRGANEGSTVDVAISFRGQGGGGEPNDPMEETIQTMALSMDWEHYSMTVAAPSDPPNPVYSARTAFRAGSGDAIDIDGVSIGSCDLEVSLSGHPPAVERGGTISFRADAINGCDDPLTFDRAVMHIRGPASLEETLYEGRSLTVDERVGTNLSLACPLLAPLGTYTVEVTIYRNAKVIGSDAFEVDVTG